MCVCHDHSSPDGVESRGQTSMSTTYGFGNAVGLTSILDRRQFFYIVLCNAITLCAPK